MHRIIKYLFITALFAILVPCGFGAEDTEVARLRETLRATMLQLRNAQADLASAQSAQAASADEKKALSEQVALLKKHGAEDQLATEKKIVEQNAIAKDQAEQIVRLKEVEAELRAKYEKEAEAAKTTESKRLQLYGQCITFERQLADLRAKNTALYRLGKEILGRYEKVGLGQQFMAREPFVGRTRVALENLVQDYDDKLGEQRASNP